MNKLKILEDWHKLGGPRSGNWGHAGRPGKRGGSVSRSVAMSIRTGKDWVKRQREAGGEGHLGDLLPADENARYGVKGLEFIVRGETVSKDSVRAAVKDSIAQQLSDDTGIPYEDVNTFIQQWAFSSNDANMKSLGIQQAISEEFGVPLSSWQQGQIAEQQKGMTPKARALAREYQDLGVPHASDDRALWDKRDRVAEEFYKESSELFGNPGSYVSLLPMTEQRKLVRAMYDNTQKELATKGIKEVTLFRGMELTKKDIREQGARAGLGLLIKGRSIYIQQNAGESWSPLKNTADGFGSTTLAASVPASRILSTARTGFGALIEQEFVLLGSPQDQVRVVKR